ncbi:ejaculatory bulb-specific protein 3 precursor, putative [Pediculus humanus corporis]|uniref:Ejaculatory bulb-specific protein 3, putative n=1 Tax=Pediculus humanus subsp. corporis TaxID=121224 RepID=E0W2K0_PEDHC|nr:ejaculatory bulb-specific protein 3 precursor, putative [Pediculus humanus corporis]EEB19856.1 ejaculatory bulb-specific protein 3 precursor, putative [Pediculus humanus corporis]
MKVAFVLFCAFALAAGARVPRDEKYSTKYDNIDLDSILKNDRLLQNYVNCLLDKGTCTPEGTDLKKVLPDALENACAKCSEAQKRGAEKVIRHLLENKKDVFTLLEAKYDPNGVYRKKYEAEAQKRKIQL